MIEEEVLINIQVPANGNLDKRLTELFVKGEEFVISLETKHGEVRVADRSGNADLTDTIFVITGSVFFED